MGSVILRVNTSLYGDEIKLRQMSPAELAWDDIKKCLVYRNHKTPDLHYMLGGGSGGGGGGVTDHAQLTGIGVNDHYDIDRHINNTDLHFSEQDRIDLDTILEASNNGSFQNFILKDDIITAYDEEVTYDDDMLFNVPVVIELLNKKADIEHVHIGYASETWVNEHFINKNQINQANGVAGLNASGKLDKGVLPEGITGGLNYKGVWDPSTNTPTLSDNGTGGSNGDYYKVNNTSDITIDGNTDWYPGDWIINNGTTWDKIDNTESVNSVNGKTGVVVINKNDIGLDEIDNTSDKDKPISDATLTALNNKEDAFEKEDAFNKSFGTGYGDVARGDHTHLDSHWHTNKLILDGMTAAFTEELDTKLDGIEDGANKYVHPTDAANKHVPVTNTANKVLTSTSTPGVYEWKSVDSIDSIPASNVTIDPDDYQYSDATNVKEILMDFDAIITTKVLWGDYNTQEVKNEDPIIYVLKMNSDRNYLFKKVTKTNTGVIITYATAINNTGYVLYDDALPNYSSLNYGTFHDATYV